LLARELEMDIKITQWVPPILWGMKGNSGPMKFENTSKFESKDGGILLIQDPRVRGENKSQWRSVFQNLSLNHKKVWISSFPVFQTLKLAQRISEKKLGSAAPKNSFESALSAKSPR
jgi:hypothetical protein